MSQGVSVVSRIVGFGLGLWLLRWGREGIFPFLRQFIRPVIVLGLFPYLLVMLLPFYYHYFSTETRAVLSVVFNAALYLPIGFAFWAWSFSLGERGKAAVAIMPRCLSIDWNFYTLFQRRYSHDTDHIFVFFVVGGNPR
jgi:hypothetical protein